MYDQQPIFGKKTLLPRLHSSNSLSMDTSTGNGQTGDGGGVCVGGAGGNENMVEPALFDIYLCDNCEAELYSLDAYLVSFFLFHSGFLTFFSFKIHIRIVNIIPI